MDDTANNLPHKTAENQQIVQLIAGYEAMAEELKHFAAMAAEIAHEVIPEWA